MSQYKNGILNLRGGVSAVLGFGTSDWADVVVAGKIAA